MVQVKVYGLRSTYEGQERSLSDAIHACTTEVLGLPRNKRFHRFMLLSAQEFFFPQDRSERYLILELSMFGGRSVAVKKQLLRALFGRLQAECGVPARDLEITLFETPRENWGIRGQSGDELALSYEVSV